MDKVHQQKPTEKSTAQKLHHHNNNISLASIIATAPARHQSTGFYVDLSLTPAQSSGVDSSATAATLSSPGGKHQHDRSHLFSMFIDFAEPSIHSPKKPLVARLRLSDDSPRLSDDSDAVVFRRKPVVPSTGHSSGRQSWTHAAGSGCGMAADMFDPQSSSMGHVVESHAVIATDVISDTVYAELEDSYSGSVASGDHGYQSMPMPLARCSRSRNSVQSLASTTSVSSSREDVMLGSAPQPPPSGKTRHFQQQHLTLPSAQPPLVPHLNTISKNSVDSLSAAYCRRDYSFSDAEEACVRLDRRSTYDNDDPAGDLDEEPAVPRHFGEQPLNSAVVNQLRKDNSLSYVGEQMLLRANKHDNNNATVVATGHTMDTLQATMERQQRLLLLETVNEEMPLSSFVKLSDMDRQPVAPAGTAADPMEVIFRNGNELKMTRSSGSAGKVMERTGGRSSMSRSMGTNLGNLASSEDTLRSLSRLFPHLSQELTLSPTDDVVALATVTACSAANHMRNGSVDHSAEYMLSDLSAVSSVTSSYSRSGIDSADEWSLSSRQPRRLGEDLLKMFLQEIATDVTLDVAGRPIRAHKCILRSRCQYFAAMLAGTDCNNGIEGPLHTQRVQLLGYSFGSVHFALCHIYSGAAHPPHGISLFELAALADLLALEGLKEVTTHALRSHYCHNFHKPCSGCIDGIMRVFPVTLQHGLDELFHKCLRWTCKHYVTVWSTRAFALLPTDLIERCVQYVVAHVNSESVLTLLLNCDSLVTMLSSCRWAIGVENTVRDLIDTARAYVADHFANLLASDCFLSLGQDQCANIARLENLLLRTAATLTPEQACRSYQRVTRLNKALRAKVNMAATEFSPSSSSLSSQEDGRAEQEENGAEEENANWNAEFLRFVEAILLAVEHCLTRQCARAMRTQQWQRMELELRKRIQGMACLTDSMESKRSSKNYSLKSAGWTPHHHHPHPQQVPDMHEVKLAMETLTKRSKQGHYPGKATVPFRVEINKKADPNLDKVTKLRKPTAVPHLTGTQPHTNHSGATTTAKPPNQPETLERNQRLFKHSISLDVAPVSHRPPPPPQQQRTCAAVPVRSASTVTRFAEIRPRYLEPKKTRFATQSFDNLTRGASNLALNKRAATGCSMKSVHLLGLSRDSLATTHSSSHGGVTTVSGATTTLAASKPKQYRSQTIIMSQDSLNSRRSQPPVAPQRSMSRDSLAKTNTRLRRPTAAIDHVVSPTSTASNATITTTRSSRLSSGYMCSPRDSIATSTGIRKSASHLSDVAIAAAKVPPRKSFLSAKSREILSKRSAALSRTESMRVPPKTTVAKALAPNGLNKSSSTSNIPRCARANNSNVSVGSASPAILQHRSSVRPTTTTASAMLRSHRSLDVVAKKAAQTATNLQIKCDMKRRRDKCVAATTTSVANGLLSGGGNDDDVRCMEPRMERSMTFCKESSDLDATTLTIVE